MTTAQREIILPCCWPHELSAPYIQYKIYVKSPPFWAYFSPCENPNDHTSCGSGHVIPTFFLFSFFWGNPTFSVLHTLSYKGGSDLQTYLGYHALITGRESVMPRCAYPGFPRILLCGFLCLLSLCILVMSGSPCEPILLIALLIYDSTHAALPHIQLCASPTFS